MGPAVLPAWLESFHILLVGLQQSLPQPSLSWIVFEPHRQRIAGRSRQFWHRRRSPLPHQRSCRSPGINVHLDDLLLGAPTMIGGRPRPSHDEKRQPTARITSAPLSAWITRFHPATPITEEAVTARSQAARTHGSSCSRHVKRLSQCSEFCPSAGCHYASPGNEKRPFSLLQYLHRALYGLGIATYPAVGL